jgi:hypothetical protein
MALDGERLDRTYREIPSDTRAEELTPCLARAPRGTRTAQT